ncbi:MAG: Crp/Fnr family transcriptional regulator [Lewinellaceae bacterium]|nr:Crp/Fnr family transcriptional regulator [Lewinellaceae bacterium]
MKTIIDPAALNQIPLFKALHPEELKHLMSTAQVITCPKGHFIYELDTESKYMYILEKGTVKIGTFASDGREALKSVCHPVTLFGELGLVGETHRQEFARTLQVENRLIAISIVEFRKIMRSNHSLCLQVLDQVGARLLQVEKRMESLIFQDARSRIVQFLKESASNRGRRVGFEWLFKHSLTQQDIANITGTSRQTVTSVLNELRKENLIHFNRRSILIRDLARLA